jgi:hypothetical protein
MKTREADNVPGFVSDRDSAIDRLNNERILTPTLMGMESPDTRRKADDSYRAR